MADALTKLQFIQAWDTELPSGVLDHADTPLPTAPTVSTPTTVDEAIIAQGVLSKYLLDVFAAYDGFTLVDLILHIGQRNAVNKAMLLASIQARDKGGKHDIAIDEPSGSTWDLSENIMFCAVELFGDLTGLEEVTVTLTKPDLSTVEAGMSNPFDNGEEVFDEENHFYTELGIYDAGEHTLEFSATVNGYTFTAGPITITAS